VKVGSWRVAVHWPLPLCSQIIWSADLISGFPMGMISRSGLVSFCMQLLEFKKCINETHCSTRKKAYTGSLSSLGMPSIDVFTCYKIFRHSLNDMSSYSKG